jgi:CBS domain-containing membrane protein
VKALPVTDEQARVLGIVTQTDLMEKTSWGTKGPRVSFAHRLRHVVRLSRAPQGSVQEIMSTRLVAARPGMLIADLVPLMSDTHIHALPVLDDHDKLAGIVTQSDLISGLFQGRLTEERPDQKREDA